MKKVFSLLLSMMLLCSFTLATTSARAATTSGMEFNKTAVANGDGTFTITLEAYATGSKVISTVTKDVPTDIILVLDQSGSMSNQIGTVSYSERGNATNSTLYNQRHNGGNENLWYKVEDNLYASVSVNVQEIGDYTPITNATNNTSWGNNDYYDYITNSRNLYAKVNGEYVKVNVTETETQSGTWWQSTYTYTYTLPDGTVIATSTGRNTQPTFTNIDTDEDIGKKVLYQLNNIDYTQSVYTYTYTDGKGVTQTIGTSTGANTVFSPTLYQKNTNTNAGGSRLNALKSAVTTFANNVAAKAVGDVTNPEDDVDHRIAIVGFAGTSSQYSNTELFIGSTQHNYRQASNYYASAFQDMSTQPGRDNIRDSIGELGADGSTYVHHGLELANGILNANPVPNGEQRNRVIIVFTDGVPGYSTNWSDDSMETGNKAIAQAQIAKNAGATVYAVGIFSGADPTTPGIWDENESTYQKANYYMQNMSSNEGVVQIPGYYLSAGDADTLNNIFKQLSENIQSGSSSATLTEEAVVKDLIAPQFKLPEGATADDITVETYKCSGKDANGNYTWTKNETTMGAKVDEDALADGKVSVTGFDFADNYVAEIKTNNVVTGYQGHKLVIKFNVTPEDKFLGGNDVYTNTSAGIYENKDAETPVIEFNRPQVNVAIEDVDVNVSTTDLNVYLLKDVTLAQIKESTDVECGDVTLDLNANNYGLDSAMTEYVNITATYTDENGNVLTDLNELKADTTYTVAVSVAPKKTNPDSKEGTIAIVKSDSETGLIKVFMPYLEYQDSAEEYHSVHTFPDYFATKNLVSKGVIWKHVDASTGTITLDTNLEKMDSAKPTVELNYTYSSDDIDSTGKIIEKEYIPVQVTIELDGVSSIKQTVIENGEEKEVDKSLTDFVTFTHICNCTQEELEASKQKDGNTFKCQWTEPSVKGDPAFLIHVYDVDGVIKITKNFVDQAGAAVETDESALFTVKDSNNKVLWTVVITGNSSEYIVGVPVGTYTVTENSDWTIRYSPTGDQQRTVTIVGGETVEKPAAVSFTNKLVDKWLIDEFTKPNVFYAEELEVSNDEAQ